MLTRKQVIFTCQLVRRSTVSDVRPGWMACRLPEVLDTLRETAADGWIEIDETVRPKYIETSSAGCHRQVDGAGWVRLTSKGQAALDLWALP